MPIYRWMPQEKVFGELNDWWATNAEEGVVSVMVGYSLGKAQRILHHLDASIGPVIVHPAIHEMNDEIRAFAPQLKQATKWTKGIKPEENRNAMILIPPGAHEVHWIEKFRPYSMGFASGWMNLRGARRWNAADRGFVISDHADWPSLLRAIQDTGAEKVFVTHGYTSVLVRYLRELGLEAEELETLFEGETQEVHSAAAHE
jgi:putative mRNA 3-end processing factor